MSPDGLASQLCKDCQLCCRGHVCRVVVTDAEAPLFPTAKFSERQLVDGRQFFTHQCPHISGDGCQIYDKRPLDCQSFTCKTLSRLSQGHLSLETAKKAVLDIKADIAKLMVDLKLDHYSDLSFQQIVKAWIAQKKHQTHPLQTRAFLSILNKLDRDVYSQSSYMSVLQSSVLAKTSDLKTPAYVIDDSALDRLVFGARDVIEDTGAKLLYSVKANAVAAVLERLAPLVDGFSCSSLPEVRIVRQVVGPDAKIHFVGPGIMPGDASTLIQECERVSYNSVSLFTRYGTQAGVKVGLRVNPHLSLNRNPKYDPCRANSKLGISIYTLKAMFHENPELFRNVDGLHVHNATGITDFQNLTATVNVIAETLPDLMQHIDWINLGGGYRLQTARNPEALRDTVRMLQNRFDLNVYLEPGTALVSKAAWLVSSVIDIFESEGQNIAVLDTSINHQLEGFIYSFPAVVGNASQDGKHTYVLAGASCLAGDLLGERRFDEPLEIGSRVVFANVGAYTHAFTTRYNGLHPPSIYQLKEDQSPRLRRHFQMGDFADACGV